MPTDDFTPGSARARRAELGVETHRVAQRRELIVTRPALDFAAMLVWRTHWGDGGASEVAAVLDEGALAALSAGARRARATTVAAADSYRAAEPRLVQLDIVDGGHPVLSLLDGNRVVAAAIELPIASRAGQVLFASSPKPSA